MKKINILLIGIFITFHTLYAQTPLWQGKGRIAKVATVMNTMMMTGLLLRCRSL